ncbi:MAG: cyclic nucleotide-binding domain-containing protein, partial [Deltaproteobacteria bacterium]|nr:cyclic nucleotide-binding domain-containing protein [Deltaproteobacteria bacterium]
MSVSETLELMKEALFFSILNNEELVQLAEASELKSVRTGELIFDQGDPGDKSYIVHSGKIRILQRNEKQQEVNLGVRTRGDHFGETALISESPRNAVARSVEDSLLISIDKDSFNKYIFSKPEIREYFDKFIKFASIHRFLKSCASLSALSPKDLQGLVQHLTDESFREGDVVFRQGSHADKLYLIESGHLKAVRWEHDKQEIINFLREGDIFGEKALVEETYRYADVVCLTDCHLFSLSKDSFYKLVAKSPKIKKAIEDRINSYLTDKPPIPYREMIKQELAASRKIKVKKDVSIEDVTPSEKKKKYYRKLSSFYRHHISLPFMRQQDHMTCGTTCIMMIAKYYGKNFASSRVRDLAHVDLSGSTLANLAFAAEQLGFSTRGMRLDYEKLRAVNHPCIVHWQGYHYIVVYRVSEKNVWVADPAVGLRKYKREYFSDNWNGITLILEPTPELQAQREDRSSFKNFIPFVLPYRMILFEIFVASILLNAFGIATPIFTQYVIDKVLYHQNVSMLNIMLIVMILVLIFRVLVSILRQYLIVHTSMKIDL